MWMDEIWIWISRSEMIFMFPVDPASVWWFGGLSPFSGSTWTHRGWIYGSMNFGDIYHGKYWSSARTWDNYPDSRLKKYEKKQLDEVLDDCLVNPIPSTIPNIEVYETGYAPNNGIYVKWPRVMVGQWDGRSTVHLQFSLRRYLPIATQGLPELALNVVRWQTQHL